MDRNTLPAASAPPVIGVAGGGRRLRLLRQLLESEGSRWRARALPARWDGGLCAVSLSQPDWEQVARCVAAGCEPVAVLGLDDPVGRSWREAPCWIWGCIPSILPPGCWEMRSGRYLLPWCRTIREWISRSF